MSSEGELVTNAVSLVGYKRVLPGDLVVNIMLAWNGSLGVSALEGIASPAYCVFRAKENVEPRFLHYLFRTQLFTGAFKTVSTGVVDSRLRLYPDTFFRLPALLPPLPEQSAIVRFLDHIDWRIQRYIRARKKLIALLNKQKQVIIYHAVTRGLDPNVRLKPSGVEWLVDVPEHWVISRVKNEFICLNRQRIPLSSAERGSMTLRLHDYYGASGVIDKVEGFLFDDELLLIAEDGANLVLRNLPLAIIAQGKFWVNNHAHILKPRRGHLDFLANLMESLNYLPWISGAAQPKLTQDRLLGIAIAVPSPAEQEKIITWVTDETAPLKVAITQAKREIDLLREYGTRLIADVVTGKLDVREPAALLREEAEKPEPIDEEEAPGEDDEAGDGPDVEAASEEAVA